MIINRDQLYNDPNIAMSVVLDNLQTRMWTAIPGIVNKVNFSQMTIDVEPTIQGSITDKDGNVDWVDLPTLINCPIVFPSGGGFTLTLPIDEEDEVLVIFACRCIDAWWQSGGIQKPIELRMHDLSDGFAIPGINSLPHVIPNISATEAQLRTDDGLTYVSIAPGGIVKVTAPTSVTITAPVTNVMGNLVVSGSILGASLATSGSGAATIGGNISASGSVSAASASISGAVSAGSVASTGDVVAGSVSLETHVHTSNTPGNPTSPPL